MAAGFTGTRTPASRQSVQLRRIVADKLHRIFAVAGCSVLAQTAIDAGLDADAVARGGAAGQFSHLSSLCCKLANGLISQAISLQSEPGDSLHVITRFYRTGFLSAARYRAKCPAAAQAALSDHRAGVAVCLLAAYPKGE